MKKTYIAPSTEVELLQVNAIMAVSLAVGEGQNGDVADARADFEIWNDVED